MTRIEFGRPLPAYLIRQGLEAVARTDSEETGFVVGFRQRMQTQYKLNLKAVFTGKELEIGNPHHYNWSLEFYPRDCHPYEWRRLGTIAIESDYLPTKKQYGGFDVGRLGDGPNSPTFDAIHLLWARGLGLKKHSANTPDDFLQFTHDSFHQQLPTLEAQLGGKPVLPETPSISTI